MRKRNVLVSRGQRSCLLLSSSHFPGSQHRHRYQRWQICKIKTSSSSLKKELMCRIRIRGPLSIHGTLLLLIALARTSCILEVLQIAASSNAPHPNEIHCLRMERSGLMRFFLPHVPWIHQLPKWNWRSLHLFASSGHSCPVEGKQVCTKLSVELLYSVPFLNNVSSYVNLKAVNKTWRNSCCYIHHVLFHYVK